MLASVTITTHARADEFALTFTKLSGLAGGSPAATAVFRADLSSVPFDAIFSVRITDASSDLGGSPGQFSGFDLDAIIVSQTLITSASSAGSVPALTIFDYSLAGTSFTPGTQRAPSDPKLFGTGASGNTVDNSVATLGMFDANSTTTIPGAFGFVSMGDGGILSFNFTQPISPAGKYLYLGEVGNNGEVLAGQITVSNVPEPSSTLLVGIGVLALLLSRGRATSRVAPKA